MPPITGSGVWTYTVVGEQDGQTTMNVIHLRDTHTGTIDDYMADADALIDTQSAVGGFNTLLRACCSDEWSITEVRVQPVYPQRMRAAIKTPAATAGLIASPAAPPNVAQVVTKYAAGATRKDIGSVHVPALPLSVLGGGVILPAHVVKLQALGDSLTQMWDSGNLVYSFRPILWSRLTPTVKRDIMTAKAQDTSRVVRRRTVRVGI